MAAITKVLESNGKPMQASAIHAAAEELLGEPVVWSSVKDALASNLGGKSPRFERLGRGRYRITQSTRA